MAYELGIRCYGEGERVIIVVDYPGEQWLVIP